MTSSYFDFSPSLNLIEIAGAANTIEVFPTTANPAVIDTLRMRVGETLINARSRGMVPNSFGDAAANSALMAQLITEQGRIVFDHGTLDTASAEYYFNETVDFGDNHMDLVGMGMAGTDFRMIGGTPAAGNHGVKWAGSNLFHTAPHIENIEISCGWAAPIGAAGLYIEGKSGSGQFGVMNNERVNISRSGSNAWDIGIWHKGFSGSRWTHAQVGGNKTGEGARVMRFGVLVDDGITSSGATVSPIDVTWDQLRVFSAETGWQIQGENAEGGIILGSQIQYVDTGIRKVYTPVSPETRYLPQEWLSVTKTHINAYRECIDLPCGKDMVIEGCELYLNDETTFTTARVIKAIGGAGTRVSAAEKCFNLKVVNNTMSGVNLPLTTTSYGVDADEYENVYIDGNLFMSILKPVRFGAQTANCVVGRNNIMRAHPQESIRAASAFAKASFITDTGTENGNIVAVTSGSNVNVTCAPNGGTITDTATLVADVSRNLYPNVMVKGDIVTVNVAGAGAFNRVYRDQATGTAVATIALGQTALIMWNGTAFVLVRLW